MKSNTLIKGATCLALGAFAVKFLGALYRIPLVNIIGAEGLGLYQMVFPVFAVLLDLSGAGVPSALSKLIAEVDEEDRKSMAVIYLKKSLKSLSVVGLLGSLIMIILAYPVCLLQGNVDAFWGYLALAPSVFLVAKISCYRGYFQGLMIMKRTAVSQIIESLIKLSVGLIVARLLSKNISLAVAGATFSITLSEVVALLYLYLKFRKSVGEKADKKVQVDKDFRKTLVKTVLPITLTGIMLPLSHFIDSFIIVNLLPIKENATAMYGLLSGVVHTIISLPVGLCYGIAVASIPSVSSLKSQEDKFERAKRSVLLTAVISLVLAVFLYLFAPFIVKILFSSLGETEKIVCIRLIRLTSPSVLFLSLVQTTNAILVGMGKYYKPVFSLGIGIFVKTIISVVLIPKPHVNIYGGGIALIACYFVSVMINFILLITKETENASKTAYRGQGQTE